MAHSPNNHYSFLPDPHTTEYLAMDHRQHDRSPSPGRKFWPFNRSRSSSPNTQGHHHHQQQQQPNLNLDTSFNTTRSRKSSNNDAVSPSGSASSFVVRSVVRSPGGVSLPTSPSGEQNQPFFSQGSRQQSASPARRMTLEDSDDDIMGQPQRLQYRRSKSKPLGAAPASLSVPAGGPGGGVGYGTARSSNDGRPESANAMNQPSPYYRPASPSGSMKAGDFQKGAKQRGRSPRKSISGTSSSHSHSGHSGIPTMEQQGSSGSAHSAQSSAANSSSGKKSVARITAGTKSLAQQQHQQHQQGSSRGPSPAGARHVAMSGPHQFPGQQFPQQQQYQQHRHHPQAPRNHSAGTPPLDQRGMMMNNFPPTMPAAQDHSPSRSRRFSFGIVNRLRRDSDAGAQPPMMPAAAPLDGLPSPVDIPFGRSPNSPLRYDNGADTDYSRANSPFGSVSPAKAGGSPHSSGFLSTLMGRQAAEEREARRNSHHDDRAPRSCSPSGIPGSNLAGKWFKGVFGRSPRTDEKDANYAADPYPSTPSGARDVEDEAAYAQKLASMRQARHIVDEERQRHFMAPTTPTAPGAKGLAGFDPAHDREFRPKQVVDSDAEDAGLDAALEFELGRKKSPPGRKPVPTYLPAAIMQGGEGDLRDTVRAPEKPLTPAQKIIQETRSKQLAREQIEAQRKQTVIQQEQLANAPPTPPKTNTNFATPAGHGQRFPSGAHQTLGESAKASNLTPTPAPAGSQQSGGGSTLAPGSGPLPLNMPLPSALQEMMIRFYRFERYSVPLIRSLETRLLDIERDSMLANNAQARSASVSSHNSAEMDRWVTQMTLLMKHEVGQLKAATREIKESRELVANIAKHGAGVMGLSNSVSSFGSLVAITPSASVQQPVEKARETNVSSSTFQSAIPRAAVVGGNKATSPTKANFGFASESGKEQKKASARDRSVSPNPRPRFTDVLGKPMVGGRLSPSPAAVSPVEGVKVEDRLKALLPATPTKQTEAKVETQDKFEQEEKEGEKSVSDDIAAALAAIDATSFTPATAEMEKEREEVENHVPITESASNSSADSAEALIEPLTPTLEQLASHPAEASEISTKSSALPYLADSKPASPVKSHFTSPSMGSASGRISPTKLFAHKLAATASITSNASTGSPKASVKLALVEKKRFTLPAPSTSATTAAATEGGMMGVTTVISARQGGKLSRTPSYPLEDASTAPTSTAFSGLAKVKPVGHTATLRERVAFFDAAK
ncbi:uncharacterized protein UHO2_07088 [Ustilago hordei]|uniref:Uncharacterized protein n=1 Tax=Ustilago hordei TaxID=120017 RepID=I2FNA1_USTHO|nr:uncharacterized protein UHO2_07088 [Ustilago hordei]KAJ1593704.1 hypothetical protein NDA12_006683 [Ustilago hordei]CCF48394.1 uncharacterized protein UHOR_08917 [Ustilago hordei]SYW81180.1 uncharacterized protein UHO2_07088 [Ustilago hordei]